MTPSVVRFIDRGRGPHSLTSCAARWPPQYAPAPADRRVSLCGLWARTAHQRGTIFRRHCASRNFPWLSSDRNWKLLCFWMNWFKLKCTTRAFVTALQLTVRYEMSVIIIIIIICVPNLKVIASSVSTIWHILIVSINWHRDLHLWVVDL